nr:MAG TPA: Protein of unknown function (DUF1043) [Bacteriophage sp.]
MIDQISYYVSLYAPTVLLAIGTVVNFIKILKGLKDNAENIMNDPKMVKLRNELDNTKTELAVIKSQLNEMIRRQGQLINEMTKVVEYEDSKNDKV